MKYLSPDIISRLDSIRNDASDSIYFQRQLEQILGKTYDVKYVNLIGRSLVPPAPEPIEEGAETFTYRQFDGVGVAAVIDGYSRQLPRVDLRSKEFTGHTRAIGCSFGWNWQDLLKAAKARVDLTAQFAKMARRAIEEALDFFIAFGSPLNGITGFLNNPNVSVTTAATSAGSHVTWATKLAESPQLLVNDVMAAFNNIATTTSEVEQADTLLLPPSSYRQLAQNFRSDLSAPTLLQQLQEVLPNLKSIKTWYRLENAGGSGTKRMVVYKDDPDYLWYVISQEFTAHPVYQDGPLQWEVPCTAMSGGVVVPYPLAMAYVDGL